MCLQTRRRIPKRAPLLLTSTPLGARPVSHRQYSYAPLPARPAAAARARTQPRISKQLPDLSAAMRTWAVEGYG